MIYAMTYYVMDTIPDHLHGISLSGLENRLQNKYGKTPAIIFMFSENDSSRLVSILDRLSPSISFSDGVYKYVPNAEKLHCHDLTDELLRENLSDRL
jgi:hypothetical protein